MFAIAVAVIALLLAIGAMRDPQVLHNLALLAIMMVPIAIVAGIVANMGFYRQRHARPELFRNKPAVPVTPRRIYGGKGNTTGREPDPARVAEFERAFARREGEES